MAKTHRRAKPAGMDVTAVTAPELTEEERAEALRRFMRYALSQSESRPAGRGFPSKQR